MRPDELVDLAAGRSPLEPTHDAPTLHQEKRRHLGDGELLDQLRMAIGVDLDDSQSFLLRDLDPGDEAFHPPGHAALSPPHEDERQARGVRGTGGGCCPTTRGGGHTL